MYKPKFSKKGEADYNHWLENNPAIAERIDELIADMSAHPFEGKGKPERLKGNLRGFWSRRITRQHRITYTVKGNLVIIVRCLAHYERKKSQFKIRIAERF